MRHPSARAVLAAFTLAGGMFAAPAVDSDILPPGGLAIPVHRLEAIPPYRAELGRDGQPVRLTRAQILAELRALSGVALNDQGDALVPPPFPRVTCRFETYSVVNHRWFGNLIFWCRGELRFEGLSYRTENWDCDDFSTAYNAIADIAQLRARQPAPPRLVGRLIVRQAHAWAGTPAVGLHEVVIFRSGKSWWVCEPQNGVKVRLEKYPNRGSIREIMFN